MVMWGNDRKWISNKEAHLKYFIIFAVSVPLCLVPIILCRNPAMAKMGHYYLAFMRLAVLVTYVAKG